MQVAAQLLEICPLTDWKICRKTDHTNLNKGVPLIYCFNFGIFVQWTASIKLLMFLLFFGAY